MSQPTDRSIPDLLGDLVDQTSTLVRKEVQLARAEFSEKLATIAAAVAVSILAATLAGVESGVGYATASLLTLLAFVLGAAPFSYSLTRRWYDSKDL